MPLYAYRCTTCGNKFEKIQNFSAEPEKICPKCGNATLERPLTAPRLQFKGTGWYINDYAPKSSESSSSETSGDSKPADSKEPAKSGEAKAAPSAPAASSAPATPSAPAPAPKASSDS